MGSTGFLSSEKFAEIQAYVEHVLQCVTTRPTNNTYELLCGSFDYRADKEILAVQSDYFGIACAFESPHDPEDLLEIPGKHEFFLRTIMLYFRTHRYIGAARPPPFDATEVPTTVIGFHSENHDILDDFPEYFLKYEYTGVVAQKIITLITSHEHFKAKRGFSVVKENEFYCRPEKLPLSIQSELFPFLWVVKNRDLTRSDDAVFHATMFGYAVKYMIIRLQELTLDALRKCVKPWNNTINGTDNCFFHAVEIVMYRKHPVNKDSSTALRNAFVDILAVNWGWMRHDEDVMNFMRNRKYQKLLHKVEIKAIEIRDECVDKILTGGSTS